ncbi:proprotein convertase subtilisin/kexin type 5-like [Orbicella faveolata]|uniref:proprotein convertase subtilisin/kexin type 5-like n=1 Tax=Orbicella faveolata TaxID=48498 RepID=UPI0009E36DC6|nr:proprotein convertase subtilisin/kexin type 5-like [Orbicella faveolata]
MKSVVIALLLVAILLFVAAEAKKRGGKGKPGGRRPWQKNVKECPRNCSDCEEGICRECDDDFALKTFSSRRFNKTVCLPCGRRLKMKYPALFLQQCVTECSKNCSSCGDNGSCEKCDDGFFKVQTRLLQRTICVPCSGKMKKKWPEVYKTECRLDACGRNCTNCSMDGVCTECEGDLKLFAPSGSHFTKCIKKCPLFHKLEKGSSPARCEVKQGKKPAKTECQKMCAECTETGVCIKCKEGLVLVKLGNLSACKNRCPFPLKNAKICEKRSRKLRKGGKMNVSADLP